MNKNVIHYLLFLGAILLLLGGCSSNTKEPTSTSMGGAEQKVHNEHMYHAENGDLRETTSSLSKLPTFLMEKPEDMQIIYSVAAQHQDLLEYIPCYCGCSDSANHQDAYDCFVFDAKENGEVVWDDHGTRCGVCLETAAESILQYNEGKRITDIRAYIDEKYKEGYSNPTPTKLPKNI